MNTERILTYSTICIIFFIAYVKSKDLEVQNYGHYDLCVESVELCKGTKKKDLTLFNLTISYDNKKRPIAYFNLTVLEDSGPGQGKGRTLKWNGKRFEHVMNYNTHVLCESNLIRKNIFDKIMLFKTVDNSCVLKKGNKFTDMNPTAFAQNFLGDKFFYGRFKTSLNFFTPKGNLMCFIVIYDIAKKNTCNKF